MELLEDHVVLSESASLVRQQIRNSSQLLGDGGGPGHGAGNLTVALDGPRVVYLSHVQVHTQADGDQVGEEEDEAEEVDVPRPVEALEYDHHEGESDGGDEQHLGQLVQLLVDQSHLGARRAGVHGGAALGAGVDDDAEGGAAGHNGVGPQRVIDAQRLLYGVVGGDGVVRHLADEVVDVLLRLLGVHRHVHVE